jgi:hypothetical protein
MVIFLFKDSRGDLVPASAYEYEKYERIRRGIVYKCAITQPRNLKYHRKYFALLNVGYENQSQYNNRKAFRRAVQIEAGHFQLIQIDDKTVFDTDSISFDAMDQPEFEKLFSDVVDVLLRKFIKGMTPEELERYIEKILGFI